MTTKWILMCIADVVLMLLMLFAAVTDAAAALDGLSVAQSVAPTVASNVASNCSCIKLLMHKITSVSTKCTMQSLMRITV